MIRSVRAYHFNPNMQCCYLFYVRMRVTQNDKARSRGIDNYRLEEPILHLLWDLVDKVSGYNFPEPEPIWMTFGIYVRTHTRKNGGNRPRGSAQGAKACFVFLLSRKRGVSATYPIRISTIFRARCNARIASAVLAIAIRLSLRLSVCPSVIRRCCVKTTARSTVQFALSDSKMCLVL